MKINRKIKVLHVIKSLGRGGAEMLIPETIALHDKNRFEFHCIYFLPWKNHLVEEIEDAGAGVTCFDKKNNIGIFFSYNKLEKYVRENGIDVIHCHLPWAGFVGRLVHKRIKIPVIYTEHNKQERYHRITHWVNKLTFNWQSRVVAVSEDVKGSIHKFINTKVPVQTLLNGVNTSKYQKGEHSIDKRKELGIPAHGIVVGTVAVFRFQKRLIEWLNVMSEAIKESDEFYGIIVGDGPLRDEIFKEYERLQLEGRVFFAGRQTNVHPWLSSFDIYMMTSVFEGLPIALLEAMSMSCAVVTTDAGGIKEVIRPNVDGLIAPVEQWQSLSDCLVRLRDKELRQQLAIAARDRVCADFSLNRMVTELEDIYSNATVTSTKPTELS